MVTDAVKAIFMTYVFYALGTLSHQAIEALDLNTEIPDDQLESESPFLMVMMWACIVVSWAILCVLVFWMLAIVTLICVSMFC